MHSAFQVKSILRCTWFAYLLTQLILYKAWTPNRIFPTVTVFSVVRNLPEESPLILYAATVVLTLVLLWKPLWKTGIVLWIGLVVLSFGFDFVFWQPYTYFFLAIVILHFFSSTSDIFWARFLLILSPLYIFSGLHKINGAFLYSVWDTYFLHKLLGITAVDSYFVYFHYAGLFVGMIEILIGLGLLFQRTRIWAFRGLISIHLLIILGLSPIGLFSNAIVVPWNVLLLVVSFTGCYLPKDCIYLYRWQLEYKKHLFFIIYFWLVPIFGFFGYYNMYFSFDLYSGKGKSMYIVYNNPNDCPESVKPFLYQRKIENKNYWVVSPTSWCKRELNLLLPKDDYILHSFAIAYIGKYPKSNGRFYITTYPFTSEVSYWMKIGLN